MIPNACPVGNSAVTLPLAGAQTKSLSNLIATPLPRAPLANASSFTSDKGSNSPSDTDTIAVSG